jgi:glutamate-1-semialdehyde aminotransferase
MGFGCAVLGYAHERVQRAVSEALESGGTLSLPHHLEMDVVRLLCELIPCSEAVLFGKNGSDVCTAAIRLARTYTGRSLILVCGYHGWQDWYIETKGFRYTGIPERLRSFVIHFPFNDRIAFRRLMRKYRGKVAAVMLEPAGPIKHDLTGPVSDADPDFLREVAELTRHEGALLIFDEIFTGFRYPGGSVQKATGVVPDLACFGKALSAGMPLSALVGRRDIFFSARSSMGYGPTYRGEVYSLAAAKEALTIYKEEDVPGRIWSHGERLKEGVNHICQRFAVPAEMVGPPFRMLLIFREASEYRRSLMRALVHQALLHEGILNYHGVFIVPSYAHDDEALATTLRAFEQVLRLLVDVDSNDTFALRLEIPPISGY